MGPAVAVEGHLHQRLIEGRDEIAEAMDATPLAQGLGQGLADGDTHVLVGVVIVDVGIAGGVDLQVEQAVAADLVEHVTEEGHAGAHLAAACAVQVKRHAHVGLG